MVRNLIIISAMLLGSLVCAQGVDGIYQLEIENDSGLIISRGTGFLVQSKSNNKPYVLTSFHLVNARLLDADRVRIKITTGGSKYLKIVAYDELNDMLALSSEGLNDQALNMSNLCSGDLNVAGYHGEKLIDLNIKGASTINKGVSKLPIYLTKGFSGAPVMNVNADVCGMVVLSSEQNASSVAVSYNMINNFLDSIDQSTKAFSVRELRLLMGIEENVTTQDELDSILSEASAHRQLIINIIPKNTDETFLIKKANNIIIEATGKLKRLVIHQSRNIMIRKIQAERIIINESDSITIESCIFEKYNQPLFLKDSSDVLILSNIFKNMNIAIVLKSTVIDIASLLSNNNFESVQNKIRNLQ